MKNKIIAFLIASVIVMVSTTARAELLMPGCRTLKANSKTATYIVKVFDTEKEVSESRSKKRPKSGYTLRFDQFKAVGIKHIIEYEANWYNPENDHLFHPQVTTHLQQKTKDGKWKTVYTFNGLQSIPSFPFIITEDGKGNRIKNTENYRFLLENKNKRDIKVHLQYTPKYR